MAVEDPTKKQIEEVDPEVAKILGLEDNFDLEQDEYMTLLKERISKGAFDEKEKLSEDDLAKLANERKRIIDLKEATFTTRKTGVNVDSFFGRKKEENEQKPVTDPAKLLPGSGGALTKYQPPEPEPEQEKKDDTSDKLKDIENFLSGTLLGIVKEIRGLTDDILSLLQKQASADKKGSELARKESEKGGKRDKEKGLENKKDEKKASGLIQAIAKPFTSIFDTIKNFILMVLLGSAVNFLWSVFKNPMMLLKPIQGLIDGITGFFNTVIQFIDSMVVQPVRTFIDAINSALNGFIGLLNSALKMLPGSPQIGQANIPNIPQPPQPPQIQSPDITGQNQQQQPQPQPKVQLRFSGGQIKPESPVVQMSNAGSVATPKEKKNPFDDTASKEGGIVNTKTTAFDISGLGPDRFMTALSLGEYILKPGAAEWLGGVEYLDKVNKMFGGSTVRKTANLGDIKIEAKSTGGQVGGPSDSSSGSNGSTSKPYSFNVNNKQFTPSQYIKNTKNTKYIPVGTNPPKSYALRYSQQGNTFTIKQINKVVKSGWNVLGGSDDALTGVDPSMPEGKSVLQSVNVKKEFVKIYRNYLENTPVSNANYPKLLKELENPNLVVNLKLDDDAQIAYWYNQAYQTHYNDWIKQGQSKNVAIQMAAKAAAEFAISKSKGSKGSWMPGSKLGAPEELKEVAVDSSPTTTLDTSDLSQPEKPLDFTSNIIRGAASVDGPSVQPTSPLIPSPSSDSRNPKREAGEPVKPVTPLISSPSSSASEQNLNKMSVTQLTKMLDPTQTGRSNPMIFEASQKARFEGKAQGLTGEALEKKVLIASILAKQGSTTTSPVSPASISTPINASSITSPTKPNIPQPPQSQPSITTLPLPNVKGSGGTSGSGSVTNGSTPIVYFNSYDSSEHNIITTAAIYNIWGM